MTEREVARLLVEILSDEGRRPESIHEFQQVLWNMPGERDESPAWRILGDLAVDLEYYEPNLRHQRESASFYGDEELESLLRTRLNDLRRLGVVVPV